MYNRTSKYYIYGELWRFESTIVELKQSARATNKIVLACRYVCCNLSV